MAFKAVVEQLDLANALKKIKGTVGKGKVAMSANSNEKYVFMEVITEPNSGNPVLKLITSNLSEISEVIVEVVTGDFGQAPLVEYDKLASMIATIDDSIEITLEQQGDAQLSINYVGRAKPIVFNGVPSEDYVQPPKVQAVSEIVLPMQVLKEGMDAAATVINDDDRYPIFNCANVKIANGEAEFTAIDSGLKRMLIYNRTTQHTNDGSFFVECNKIRRMINGFDYTQDVKIHLSSNNVVFEQGDLKLMSRLLEGNFPDCHKFMPAQYAIEAVFNREEMLASLNRAKIMMDQGSMMTKSVVYNIDQGFITINLNSTFGMLFESVMCNLNGKPLQIAFLVDCLINALNSFSADDMKLCFYNRSCGILTPVNPTGYTHKVLVPAVRLTNE